MGSFLVEVLFHLVIISRLSIVDLSELPHFLLVLTTLTSVRAARPLALNNPNSTFVRPHPTAARPIRCRVPEPDFPAHSLALSSLARPAAVIIFCSRRIAHTAAVTFKFTYRQVPAAPVLVARAPLLLLTIPPSFSSLLGPPFYSTYVPPVLVGICAGTVLVGTW